MSWDLASCEDAELIKIADRLNRCKESKVMLELELTNEEFRLKYIHKRKALTASKARTRMMYIVPFTIVELSCIVLFITSIIGLKTEGYSIAVMISMLISILGFLFCGYFCIRLWLPEIKMFGKLNPLGKNRDEDKGVVTFEMERKLSEEKISVLRAQIDTVTREISQLFMKKREREAVLRSQMAAEQETAVGGKDLASLSGETDSASTGGLFKIKKDKLSNIQTTELIENYGREIKALEKEKTKLELEDKKLQDKIIDIDMQISVVKDKIVAFVMWVTGLLVIVNMIHGTGQHIAGGIWCLISIIYMLWLVKECKQPVILYLVEHENKQIRDYAFTHSLTPLHKKRKELAQDIADCARGINNFESKIQELTYQEPM